MSQDNKQYLYKIVMVPYKTGTIPVTGWRELGELLNDAPAYHYWFVEDVDAAVLMRGEVIPGMVPHTVCSPLQIMPIDFFVEKVDLSPDSIKNLILQAKQLAKNKSYASFNIAYESVLKKAKYRFKPSLLTKIKEDSV